MAAVRFGVIGPVIDLQMKTVVGRKAEGWAVARIAADRLLEQVERLIDPVLIIGKVMRERTQVQIVSREIVRRALG